MRLENIARWKKALFVLVLFEVLFGVLMILIAFSDNTYPILDMRLAYNFDTFKEAMNLEGVRLYVVLFRLLDMVFPIAYVWFFLVITENKLYVKIAIVFAAIFDYIENVMQVVYLFLEDHDVFQMILLISVTWMKFAWLGIAILFTIYYYINNHLEKRKQS